MSKNIVVCCDGTNNEFKEDKSNVLKLAELISWDDKQKVFYDPGVGTFSATAWPGSDSIGRCMGSLFGYGIKQNIKESYRFLMREYEHGDRIFIFGFSRGAYTARCLAAIVSQYGLLHSHHENLLPYVVKDYLKPGSLEKNSPFTRDMARRVSIHFLGVWDTVASVGSVFSFHKTEKAEHVRLINHAVQALSIDEKRKKFEPLPLDNLMSKEGGNIKEVWFAGVHSDVGGGYPETGLSNISLCWVVSEARLHGLQTDIDIENIYAGDISQEINDSFELPLCLLGPRVRMIPDEANIHRSVIDKRDQYSNYRPRNLPRNPRIWEASAS